MAFLNATLLLGALAAAIPLALHLLGRRQPRPVVFPAVRFLQQRLETNRRRIQVRKWLLLILRMAVVVLIALALAQPAIPYGETGTWLSIGVLFALGAAVAGIAVWAFATGRPRGWTVGLAAVGAALSLASLGWAGAVFSRSGRTEVDRSGPAAVAIVLDNSLRMTYREGGQSRLEAAKEIGDWLLSRYPIESRFAVLDVTPRPASFAIDAPAARRALAEARAVAATEPIQRRVTDAIRLVRTSDLERKAVYVLTDLSAAAWRDAAEPPLAELLAEEPPVLLQPIDVGGESRVNLAVNEIRAPQMPVSSGVPIRLAATIAASPGTTQGEPLESAVELRLFENDPAAPVLRNGTVVYPDVDVVDRKPILVPRGGAAEAVLDLPALEPGIWFAEVRVTSPDPISADDVRAIAVQVAEPPRVHVAGDHPTERSAMVQVLAPMELQAQGQTDFAVTASSISELDNTELFELDALVVLDPERITRRTRDWIAGGGKALIFVGPNWPAANAAGEVSAAESPADLLVASAKRQWRVPDVGTFLEVRNDRYPPLADFVQDYEVPWPQYPVRRYWQVEPVDAATAPVIYAGTDHAAIVDGVSGAGRVALVTTPLPALDGPAADWNELLSGADAWPGFLLVRGLVGGLARPYVGTINVAVGSAVSLPRRRDQPDRYQLFTPSGPPVAVQANMESIAPGPAQEAGIYYLRGAGLQRGYAAALTPLMTDTARIDAATLSGVLGDAAAKPARELAEIELTEEGGGGGQPFYSQAMVLLCLLWMLELTLSGKFYSEPGRQAAHA